MEDAKQRILEKSLELFSTKSLAKLDAHVKLFFRTFNMERGKK